MTDFPYYYIAVKLDYWQKEKRTEWCEKQFGKENQFWCWEWDNTTTIMQDKFYFKKEEDMTWFIMRWSS